MDYLIILVAIIGYFIPAIAGHNTKYCDGIILLNLFLGWTGIGWVGALIWAVSAPKKEVRR